MRLTIIRSLVLGLWLAGALSGATAQSAGELNEWDPAYSLGPGYSSPSPQRRPSTIAPNLPGQQRQSKGSNVDNSGRASSAQQLFGTPSQWPKYVPNNNPVSNDPIAQRRFARMAQMERDTPPPSSPVMLGAETLHLCVPGLEKAAFGPLIRTSYGAAFYYKPDGGGPETPWWVVDGYKSPPSVYDP